MAQRTDHSDIVSRLRAQADRRDALPFPMAVDRERSIAERAAADLIEMHDATGINLHAAPGLLAFVENVACNEIVDNGA